MNGAEHQTGKFYSLINIFLGVSKSRYINQIESCRALQRTVCCTIWNIAHQRFSNLIIVYKFIYLSKIRSKQRASNNVDIGNMTS